MVFMIMADGEPDQIVETREIAKREAKDLRDMGCNVKVKPFPTWEAAYAFEDKFKAYL